MATAPTNIRVLKSEGVLELAWDNGTSHRFPFRFLRGECPCAACVNEFTGERMLDPTTLPEDIAPVEMNLSGNYALKVTWSDQHMTGLYSWEHFERLTSHDAVESITV